MSVSGERDHWKEPSKYLETWEPTWNGKTPCKVVLKDFFSKADYLKRKNQERTNWQRAKEQRLVFIHSLVHLPVYKAFGSVNLLAVSSPFLIQFWSEIDEPAQLPSQWQYIISAQHCRTKSPRDHIVIVFTGHTKSQWHSLEHHGCHSLSVKREVTCHIQQSNIQQSNLPTQAVALIGEEYGRMSCFSCGAALAPHCGVTWFSLELEPAGLNGWKSWRYTSHSHGQQV